jgi:hypothetical protein
MSQEKVEPTSSRCYVVAVRLRKFTPILSRFGRFSRPPWIPFANRLTEVDLRNTVSNLVEAVENQLLRRSL